jgi:hypothetical protein
LNQSHDTIIDDASKFTFNAFVNHAQSFFFNISDSCCLDVYLVCNRADTHNSPALAIIFIFLDEDFSAAMNYCVELVGSLIYQFSSFYLSRYKNKPIPDFANYSA